MVVARDSHSIKTEVTSSWGTCCCGALHTVAATEPAVCIALVPADNLSNATRTLDTTAVTFRTATLPDACKIWQLVGKSGVLDENSSEQTSVDSPSRLGSAAIALYEQDGFHHAGELFSQAEATELLTEAIRLAEARPRPGVVIEPGSNVVRSLFRFHRANEMFRAVAHVHGWLMCRWEPTYGNQRIAARARANRAS